MFFSLLSEDNAFLTHICIFMVLSDYCLFLQMSILCYTRLLSPLLRNISKNLGLLDDEII